MSNSKKWLVVLLSVLVTVLCGVALAACNSNSVWRNPKNAISGMYDPNNPNNDKPFYFQDGTDPDQYKDDESTYKLKVISKGGLPLENVKITVSRNGIEYASARSDANGNISLAIAPDNYNISYDELPDGYFTDKDTLITLDKTNKSVSLVLSSAVIDKTVPAGYVYSAGEVMYNFTYTDPEGDVANLKELLRDHKCVLLNFFYTTCTPCLGEFPAIKNVYERYSNDVAIVSLDPRDSVGEVTSFKAENNISFFMARDNQNLFNGHFMTGAYPTNVFIDRYGVIAYIDVGGQPDEFYWTSLFDRLIAENYEQSSDLVDSSHGGNTENPPPKKPDYTEDEWNALPTGDQLAEAAYYGYESMTEKPTFYRPNKDNGNTENDIANSWPFEIGADDDGRYIYPGNVGTDNTYSFIYTDISLQTDQVLSLEMKLNMEASGDSVTFVINQTLNYDLQFFGSTDGQWREVILYTATRPTDINLNIMFIKDLIGTLSDEFVGIRNIKISNIEADPNKPLDVRTEMAAQQADGSLKYADYYLNPDDGFYHMGTLENKTESDPIIYCEVENETTWSLRHLIKYSFKVENKPATKSAWNLAFWLFNPGVGDDGDVTEFDFDPNGMLIEAHYFGYMSYGEDESGADIHYLAPVTNDMKDALIGFTRTASEQISSYENGFNENTTWLELCVYFRTLGDKEGHNNKDHKCLSTQIPERGIGPSVAIEIPSETSAEVDVKNYESIRAYMVSPLGGLIYKFKAPTAGVYRFTTSDLDKPGEPAMYAFKDKASINKKESITSHIGNFGEDDNVCLYLAQNEEIYLLLGENTFAANYISYKMHIDWYKDKVWIKENASSNAPTTPLEGGASYYPTIDMVQEDYGNGKYYYQSLSDGTGSPIYIDFISQKAAWGNRSLYEINEHGLSGAAVPGDLKSVFDSYYTLATKDKSPSDRDFGLLKASVEVVNNLKLFTDTFSQANENYAIDIWATFAVYFRYVGPDPSGWEDMP